MSDRNPSGEIRKFYNDYPFPNLNIKSKKDFKKNGLYKLIYPLTKNYLKAGKLKILDAGCGTGELMLGIEKKGMEIDGIDLSQASIEIAKKRANKFRSRIKFRVFDFVKNPLPKNRYDLVYSIGVLHHTDNPPYSFKKLVRSTKIGGYIIIGVYNPFGEFRFKLKRGIVHLLAGRSIIKRVQIGQKLFYKREHKLSTEEWTGIADAYANPYRKYYTFNQLLHWFKDNNITFIISLPPVSIVRNLHYIYEIMQNLFRNRSLNMIVSYQKMVDRDIQIQPWELNPVLTFLVQVLWLIIGRGTLINMVGKKIK